MTEPRTFGAWLRREREARSVSLRAIADRTKIGAGLLEALERGDISRWPGGIYRRAFVRAYAEAIGLDADRVVASFERAFPPDPATNAEQATVPTAAGPELRLALAAPPASRVNVAALKTAGRDLGVVLAAAVAGWLFAGATGFWCAAAIAATAFHLSGLFGVSYRAAWRDLVNRRRLAPRTGAEVVDFARPARARRAGRILADLSAAATSAALSRRRRAARS